MKAFLTDVTKVVIGIVVIGGVSIVMFKLAMLLMCWGV